MASPTTPMHGKLAAVYRFRPNGFKGDGLNDASWGSGYNGASSGYFEVVIDGAGTPDTFKWRKNGGAWTAGVAITGAAQTLSDGQQITFGVTTGHTVNDQWTIGNFKDEPCTEAAEQAQITDSTKRLLNPDSLPTFTDSGGEKVLVVDCVRGMATFRDDVTIVDVDGNNGFIVESGLEKVGYLIGWEFDASLDMADASRCGQNWKEALPGQAGFNGKADAYFIGTDSFFDSLLAGAAGTKKKCLLQLFNYDPDQDQTGDHFVCWAVISGVRVNAPIGEVVKEAVTFQGDGIPCFVSNV